VPLEKNQPEQAYSLLESVWFSWYGWWQPRFPKP
jgi:cyanosortase A-associated protein